VKAALAEGEAQEAPAAAGAATRSTHATVEAEAGRTLRGRKPKDRHAADERAKANLGATEVTAERHPDRADLADNVEVARKLAEAAERAAAASPTEQISVNITDPESRIMKTQTGWVQGDNVQAAVNTEQVVIAYAATKDHNDAGQLVPMIEATEARAARAGIEEEIGLVTDAYRFPWRAPPWVEGGAMTTPPRERDGQRARERPVVAERHRRRERARRAPRRPTCRQDRERGR